MLIKVLIVFLFLNPFIYDDESDLLDEKLKQDIKKWTAYMKKNDLARKIELETNHVEVQKLGGSTINNVKERIVLKNGKSETVIMDYETIKFTNSKKIKDSDLGLVLRFKNLKRLNLSNTGISDLGVDSIAKAAKLETLELAKTAITVESIRKLAQIKNLKRLDLAETKITDAGTSGFSQFENLEDLNLSQTQVGDNCVKSLVKMPSLKVLNLSRTKISDASLDILSQMENLKKLETYDSGLSDLARKKLQIRLPNCYVN